MYELLGRTYSAFMPSSQRLICSLFFLNTIGGCSSATICVLAVTPKT